MDTQIILDDGSGRKRVEGRLVKIPSDQIVCLGPNNKQDFYQWGSIRRLSFVPIRQRYVLFRHENPEDRMSELERIDGCNLATLSPVGEIVTRENQSITFKMRHVVDYTSAMFE